MNCSRIFSGLSLLTVLTALAWIVVLRRQLQDNQQVAAQQQQQWQEQLAASQQSNAGLAANLKAARDSVQWLQNASSLAERRAQNAEREVLVETRIRDTAFQKALRFWEEHRNAHLHGNEWKTKVDLLIFGNMGLYRLPSQTYQCQGLKTLWLGNNPNLELREVFPKLAHLPLETLVLNRCANLSVPPEIGQLTHLKTLDLSYNEMTTLPYELSRLQRLTHLDLSYNNLRGLPTCVSALPELTDLDLTSNEMEVLSPGIGALKKLTQLDLGGNQLRSLPPQIGFLTELTDLNLSLNKLQTLPPEMAALKKLRKLDLHDNKIPKSEWESIRQMLPKGCYIRFEW